MLQPWESDTSHSMQFSGDWRSTPLSFHQLGWSYSYFVIFVSVCLSVCHSLGKPAWERVNGGSCHIWVSWLVCLPAAKESKTMSVLSTVEAQLSLHSAISRKQEMKSSPRSTGMVRNRWLTTNKARSEITLVLQYSMFCKRAPWPSRLAEPARIHQYTSR